LTPIKTCPLSQALNEGDLIANVERTMNIALQDLFTTDIGILSLITIVVVLVIGAYMGAFVRRHIAEDEAAHAHDVAEAGRPPKGE
jgi:hypothetical protein